MSISKGGRWCEVSFICTATAIFDLQTVHSVALSASKAPQTRDIEKSRTYQCRDGGRFLPVSGRFIASSFGCRPRRLRYSCPVSPSPLWLENVVLPVSSADANVFSFEVTLDENSERLDKILSGRYPDQSRQYLQYLIGEGLVSINGVTPVKKRDRVREKDVIQVKFLPSKPLRAEPEDIPLHVLYEDDHLIAINKEAGMVVHPSAGNWTGTLVNAVMFYFADAPLFCESISAADTPPVPHPLDTTADDHDADADDDVADVPISYLQALRPGIVHRLDKDTSGVILVAKTAQAQQRLIRLFHDRIVHKEYIAVVAGPVANADAGAAVQLDLPIGRHPVQRHRMAVRPEAEGARRAITTFTRLGHNPRFALSVVALRISTGRTHQIRVHMKHRGHPVLGDSIYGNDAFNRRFSGMAPRQLLHAYRIRLPHPVLADQVIDITAPLPQDMASVVARITPQWADLAGDIQWPDP